MDEGIFALIGDKLDHLYAMQLAGFSTLATLQLAQMKQSTLGRALTDEEMCEMKQNGSAMVAESYRIAIEVRDSVAGKPPTQKKK